jgi:DNA-binding transcriptional LysR family regulator
MDRFDLFRIFARVVETSSFTRAAATLGIPRSTVSTAIGVLEARLGARLLNRTTRTVSATQDGLLFYERCLRLIADVEEAEATFRRDGKRPAGKLHVDMPGRIGRLIVAPALPDFVARYPEIELQMGLTDRTVDLVGENIDCALRVGPLGNSELIARPIGILPLINVASPAYLARHGTPQTPDDLKAHLAVRYASPSTGKVELWEWIEDGTLRSTPMQGPITVNSAEAYIACCLAGLGLIQIPAYDVKDHLRSARWSRSCRSIGPSLCP